ncbi:MAG: prolyl oligopeptidase family serine peptidase, partial [Clostridia bacterium]|nr:prolyl oligopeptidase family serine peptidase [Clostridia bacterium]
MKKLIAITLGIILVVAGLVVPAAAEETVLGMVGRTFTASDQTVLPYRMYAPTGDAPENGFAVYMHFHGVGECGSDNVSQTATGMELVKKIIQDKGQEAIVLVPQCDTGSTWVNVPFAQGIYSTDEVAMSRYLTAAMELLEAVKSQNKIDMDRLYIGGLSMGGYAVWDLLARYPDTFAAAIPVCGGGDPAKAENMKEVAIRTYHSDDDPTVPVAGTRALVEAVQTVGGNIAYKEFTNMGHNCWTRAFNMPDQVNWLFSQSRQPEEQPSVPQEQPSVPQEQPSVPQEPVWEQGDVNEDSQVDAKDALLVLKSAVGKITLTDGQSNRADVNRDEAIDAKDALDILKYAVGKIDSFAPLPGEPVVPPVDQPEVITPTDFPLEDSSTGKVNPRLVTTKYATQEVVVADIIPTEDGYAVNPD